MEEKDDTTKVDPRKFNHIKHKEKRSFLRAYARLGVIGRSCIAAGIDRVSTWHWRNDDAEFAASFKDAEEMAIERAEQEAWRRALEGCRELVLHQGKPVLVPLDPSNPNGDKQYLYRTTRSDILLMFMLKGARPHKYRDVTIPAPQEEEKSRDGYDDLESLPPDQAEEVLNKIDAAHSAKN